MPLGAVETSMSIRQQEQTDKAAPYGREKGEGVQSQGVHLKKQWRAECLGIDMQVCAHLWRGQAEFMSVWKIRAASSANNISLFS